MSLGFAVSPVVLDLLVSKFDKSGGKNKAIEYDNFIEYVFPFRAILHILLKCMYIFIGLCECLTSNIFLSYRDFRCCLTVKV